MSSESNAASCWHTSGRSEEMKPEAFLKSSRQCFLLHMHARYVTSFLYLCVMRQRSGKTGGGVNLSTTVDVREATVGCGGTIGMLVRMIQI